MWVSWCEGKPQNGWRKDFDSHSFDRVVAWKEGIPSGKGPTGHTYWTFVDLSLRCRISGSNVKSDGSLEPGGMRDLEAYNANLEAVRKRLGLTDEQMEQLVQQPVCKVIQATPETSARVMLPGATILGTAQMHAHG